MFLLIDNYDSFTYNLFHLLGEVGVQTVVKRNDALSAEAALALGPEAIVISPGPCDPDRAGICLDLIRRAAGRVPILGVCLGHQSIGQAFGGRVVRAPAPMHGKVSAIRHRGTDLFEGLSSPFTANRYHSLMVARDGLPSCLKITAESEDGVIQGLAHVDHPVYGVQFHPESIATEHGHALVANFKRLAGSARAAA
ncbi:MAG: aminodeoxychorismate/anthranilate synthase component II [Rhodospirillales bacterium]|nr:MAG: aminodeoxychorismate/anthranilate synthase component II [Rhodospirillales bacterium]